MTYALSVVPDPVKVMSEIVRVCRPGAKIAVWDSIRSDIPSVAKNQDLMNYFTSKYGIPEGLIVFT